MEGASDSPTTTISDLAHSCIDLFHKCLSRDRNTFARLESDERRLWVWSNSLKVFEKQHINLDAQLKRNPRIREIVQLLLGVLKDNLSLAFNCEPLDHNVLEIPFYGIDGSLKRLEKIGTAIAYATHASLARRVLLYAKKQPDCREISRTFSLSLLFRYRGLGPDDMPMFDIPEKFVPDPDKKVLVLQPIGLFLSLLKTSLVRHYRICYQRRMLHENSKKAVPQVLSGENVKSQEDEIHLPKPILDQSRKLPDEPPPKPKPQNTHSEVMSNTLTLETAVFKKKLSEEASTSLSRDERQLVSEAGAAMIPRPPKVPPDQNSGRCPICRQTLPANIFQNRSSWISHVHKDIMPYVCISQDCMSDIQFFEDSTSWINHMQKTHTTHWVRYLHNTYRWNCPVCHDDSSIEFLSKQEMEQDLIEHFEQSHPAVIEVSNRGHLASISGVPQHRPADTCPICGTIHRLMPLPETLVMPLNDEANYKTEDTAGSKVRDFSKTTTATRKARFADSAKVESKDIKDSSKPDADHAFKTSNGRSSRPSRLTAVEKCISDHLKGIAFNFSSRLIDDDDEQGDGSDGDYKSAAASDVSMESNLLALLDLPSVGSNADPPQLPPTHYDGPIVTDKEKEEVKLCIARNSKELHESYKWDDNRRCEDVKLSSAELEDMFPEVKRKTNERIWKGMDPRYALGYVACLSIVLQLSKNVLAAMDENRHLKITLISEQLKMFSSALKNFPGRDPNIKIDPKGYFSAIHKCVLKSQDEISKFAKIGLESDPQQSSNDIRNKIIEIERTVWQNTVLADINGRLKDIAVLDDHELPSFLPSNARKLIRQITFHIRRGETSIFQAVVEGVESYLGGDIRRQTFTSHDYTIGWICALPQTEFVAAIAMLDEEHPVLPNPPQDTNYYRLGRIGGHNVVIACLSAEKTGTVSTAVVVKNVLHTFGALRICLLVGVGGGAPYYPIETKDNETESNDEDEWGANARDIRLGDVVVGLRSKTSGALVQYDLGKVVQGETEGIFARTESSSDPPNALRTALSHMRALHTLKGQSFSEHLERIFANQPELNAIFKHPGSSKDQLIRSGVVHLNDKWSCENCRGVEDVNLVKRSDRPETTPTIHYGTICSVNQVMEDATLRDKLAEEDKILCFEEEASGLPVLFPCLIIRGICDYADSHKNKIWQPYAAATAAAFAREFLRFVAVVDVPREQRIGDIPVNQFSQILPQIHTTLGEHTKTQAEQQISSEEKLCLQTLKVSSYDLLKNRHPKKAYGTCDWVFGNPKYLGWFDASRDDLLWISAEPGCGKSVLSRSLVDEEFKESQTRSTCYFFFALRMQEDTLALALCALLHQLFSSQPCLLKYAIQAWKDFGSMLPNETTKLWDIFIKAATSPEAHNVICVLDALDECRPQDRKELIYILSEFYLTAPSQQSRKHSLKFIVTSRSLPYMYVKGGVPDILAYLPTIDLSGEEEWAIFHADIDLVSEERVNQLAKDYQLQETYASALGNTLLGIQHRTYHWLHLAIESIKQQLENGLRSDLKAPNTIQVPSSIQDAYEKILGNIKQSDRQYVKTIFHIIVGALRPLSVAEMTFAFGLSTEPGLRAQEYLEMDQGQFEQRLRTWCGLFVTIQNSQVYLIHQSAREFLVGQDTSEQNHQWKHSLRPQDSAIVMASISVDFLLLDNLTPTSQTESIQNALPDARFGFGGIHRNAEGSYTDLKKLQEYVSTHWAAHVRDSTENETIPMFEKVCKLYDLNHPRFTQWFPIFWKSYSHSQKPPKMSQIMLAAFNGHLEVAQHFMNQQQPFDIDATDDEGRTALYWAAKMGHVKITRLLIEHRARIESLNHHGNNALQAASEKGHQAVVDLLLQAGTDVNMQGGHYGSALQAASEKGHQAVVDLLLQKGADVNMQGGHYGSALQAASEKGHQAVVDLLLQKGADVNMQGGHYGSALQAASEKGHQAVVDLLLQKGADVNMQGGHYGNALQAASEKGHQAVVDLLLQKGADVNMQGGHYGSALQAASEKGHQVVVDLLLQKGADMNI